MNLLAAASPDWLFLVPFTLFWWVMVAAVSVFIIWSLEYEHYVGIAGVVILTMLGTWYFGGVNFYALITQRPLTLLAWVGGYFVVGAVYSVLKWWLFASGRRHEYDDLKKSWLLRNGVDGTTVPEEKKAEWETYLLATNDYDHGHQKWWRSWGLNKKKLSIIPTAWDFKARISAWIMVWPWSAFWTMFDDVFRRIAERLQRLLGHMMDAIAHFTFKGTEDDFEKKDGM